MNTETRIIYVPGYREENIKKQPWFELEKFCKETNKKFARITLPWELYNAPNKKFSGTATRNKMIDYLNSLHKTPIILNVYSLSCRELVNAILGSRDKVLPLIKSINFIHPNIHPLLSISRMDWATSHLEKPLDMEAYLNDDAEKVFSRLMKPIRNNEIWLWDPQQFQKDLKQYQTEDNLGWNFNFKVNKLRSIGIECSVYSWDNDQIVHQNSCIDFSNRWKIKALATHRPSKETLLAIQEDILK